MTELDVDHLRSWIGRKETMHDRVTRFPVAALSATLDREDPPPEAGDPLPPLWHWLYFLPTARQSNLGAGIRRAAGFCRRCRCRGGCGPVGGSPSISRC